MNSTITTRALRLICIFGSIAVLASLFWFATELYSSDYGDNTLPSNLVSEMAPLPSESLPEGVKDNESQNLASRELYAALNDTIYSNLPHHEASRAIAQAAPETNLAEGTAPEVLTAKVQCNIRTNASSIDSQNGVAHNNKECM